MLKYNFFFARMKLVIRYRLYYIMNIYTAENNNYTCTCSVSTLTCRGEWGAWKARYRNNGTDLSWFPTISMARFLYSNWNQIVGIVITPSTTTLNFFLSLQNLDISKIYFVFLLKLTLQFNTRIHAYMYIINHLDVYTVKNTHCWVAIHIFPGIVRVLRSYCRKIVPEVLISR